LQFHPAALTTEAISTLVAAKACHRECLGQCWGPGERACSSYIQLTDETQPWTSNQDQFIWYRDDPPLQGHTFTSRDISYTGWYNITTITSFLWVTLLRVHNIDADCEYGARLLSIWYNQWSNFFTAHIKTTGPCVDSDYDPALTMNIKDRWMYVTESVTVGSDSSTIQHCYGIFGEENIWYCNTFSKAGLGDTFGSHPDSFITIGDYYEPQYNTRMIGQTGDNRYYYNSALSTADFADLYAQRSSTCTENCQTCLNPFQCGACLPGFYLSNGLCVRCNSCCSVCTGPGKDLCSVCTTGCQYTAPSTCWNCGSGCLSCDQSWHCLVCESGLYLEFHSSMCVAVCPSGFTSSGSQCLPLLSTTLIDLTFDKAENQGVFSDFTIKSGLTTSKYPPRFNNDQPIPSKHRGLYFSGAQFLQLLPSTSILLAPSLTIDTWIRPQGSDTRTIFAKSIGCLSILTLRINNSGYIEIATEHSTVSADTALKADVWTHIAATVTYNSHLEDTNLELYHNGLRIKSVQIPRLWDEHLTAAYNIGRNGESDYFKGFIWSVSVHNSVLSASDIAGKVASAGCPSGLSFCLSPAASLQTAEEEACLPACVYGCVRTTDCSLCADKFCSVCADFETTLQTCRANGAQPCSCLQGGLAF